MTTTTHPHGQTTKKSAERSEGEASLFFLDAVKGCQRRRNTDLPPVIRAEVGRKAKRTTIGVFFACEIAGSNKNFAENPRQCFCASGKRKNPFKENPTKKGFFL